MAYERHIWEINGKKIPVKLHYEMRRSSRASIGKKEVLVRIPTVLPRRAKIKQVQWAKDWLANVIEEKPEALNHILIEDLPESYELTILEVPHQVHINYIPTPQVEVKWDNKTIEVSISDSLSLYDTKQEVMKILAEITANRYIDPFRELVDKINRNCFKLKYGKVKLRNNRSRWGSCSSKGNLNFSTRLLLCPRYVIIYIIVHELAHRVEMNHSHRFWEIVEKVDPNYRKAERWLKTYGKKVDFV